MASASAATQNVMDQIAAGGDSLPSAWSSLLVSGTRAAINLMPNSFRYHQAFNMVDHKNLQETCNYAAAFLQNCQTQGDLRWTFLNACLQVLQNTDDLERFLPYDGLRVQYVGSDSVLTLRNTERPPFRHWETLWGKNSKSGRSTSPNLTLQFGMVVWLQMCVQDCRRFCHRTILQGETPMLSQTTFRS